MKTSATRCLIAAMALSPAMASADWSANVGYTSEYIFRGITQKTSSASAGIDFQQGSFYAGSWAADVGDGLEVDGYFGYGFELSEDTSLSIGATGYFYTGDFDDTYLEVNLGAAFALFSVDVALGEYENFAGPTLDYSFTSVSAEHNGFSATLGSFGQDFDGEYLELGYATSIADWDVGVSLVASNSDLVGPGGDETILFSIGRGFEL
ncbi:MAG: TorF family putative porin [Pseudomonadota bacterium]